MEIERIEVKSKKEYDDFSNLQVTRSNRLIESRNINGLIQNKILTYAMARAVITDTMNPVAEFNVSELRQYGLNTKNLAATVRKMDAMGINKSYMIPDEEGDGFTYFNMIDTFRYDGKGHISVKFTQGMAEHILQIKSPFTTNRIKVLFLFRHNSSYRIYELLSTKEYLFKKKSVDKIIIKYNLAELKMQLGLIFLPADKNEILRTKLKRKPTADEIVEAYPELEVHRRWDNFKRKVLEIAREEINELAEKSDIFTFDYEPIRKGIGGKVNEIRFFMYPNKKYNVLTEVRAFMKDELITDEDIRSLLKASDNDINKIHKVYKLAKKQRTLHNLVGWMLSALKNNYEEFYSDNRMSPEEAQSFHEKAEILAEWWKNKQEQKNELDANRGVEEQESLDRNYDTKIELGLHEDYYSNYDVDISQLYNYCENMCSTGRIDELLETLVNTEIELDVKDLDVRLYIKKCFLLLGESIFEDTFLLRTINQIMSMSNYNISLLAKAYQIALDRPVGDNIDEMFLDILKDVVEA